MILDRGAKKASAAFAEDDGAKVETNVIHNIAFKLA